MNKIIALIGPELIGKNTVANRVAEYTSTSVVSTRDVCSYHPLYTCEREESMEVFDRLKERIDETGARVVEIGTNVIETCTQKELDYLKKVLTINGNEPSIYLVLPSQDFSKNNKYLTNLYTQKYGAMRGMLVHVSTALYNPAYDMLEPTRLYTLDGFRKPLFNAKDAYQKHLDHSVLLPILSDIARDSDKVIKPTK